MTGLKLQRCDLGRILIDIMDENCLPWCAVYRAIANQNSVVFYFVLQYLNIYYLNLHHEGDKSYNKLKNNMTDSTVYAVMAFRAFPVVAKLRPAIVFKLNSL